MYVCIYSYQLFSLPKRVLWLDPAEPISNIHWVWLALDWTIDLIFVLNIYVKMNWLCVLDGDNMIITRADIRAAYLWSRDFWVDASAVLPFELILLLFNVNIPLGYLRLNRVLNVNSCKVDI